MRIKYWNMYFRRQFSCDYISLYATKSLKIDNIISFCLLALSSSSIAGWAIWKSYPALWGVLIAVSQLISLGKGFFPWSKRLNATKYYLPEIQSLLYRIDRDWSRIDIEKLNESDINNLIYQYDNEYHEIERRYIEVPLFPHDEKMAEKATNISKAFFNQRFNLSKEVNTNVQREAISAK